MTNWGLLNMCDYTNRHTVARLLRRHDTLYRLAERGDMVALCIYIDLANAIMADKVLTARQREILSFWMEGYDQTQIASMCEISSVTVFILLARISVKISKYLCKVSNFSPPVHLLSERVYSNLERDTPDGEKEKESSENVV